MSNIPPTAKTKALPQSDAVSTATHEKLLMLTWAKIDPLVASLFGILPPAQTAAIGAAKEAYRVHMDALADQAESYLAKGGGRFGEPLGASNERLQRLVERLRAHGACEPDAVDESCFSAKVRRRELERPLYATKGTGATTRQECVGFVDIACDLDVPGTLCILGTPWLHTFEVEEVLADYFADPLTKEFGIGAEAAERVRIPAPSWLMSRTFPKLWIDVRPGDTPIGQLVRELKALRDFGDAANDKVLVVVESIDDTKRAMLKHEDILVVTQLELELL